MSAADRDDDARRAVAGRLVVGLAGTVLTGAERRWLERWRPAGVILFARNAGSPERWERLLADLRRALPPRAECCADHEGGPVSFLQAVAGRPPAPRTLGDLDDPDLTRRVHEQTGRRLRRLGLDRVLAPCCDVLRETGSAVIGARSFGVDPDLVARHAAAAVEGLRAAGLRACAKHWPGHGGTRADTHETRAEADPAAGAAGDREPFAAALAAGADAVMVGHLPVGCGRPPATLDAAVLAALRRDLPARTLLWSDDVTMGALRGPLAALGAPAPDGRTDGLVDPAALPFAWLRAVADAGCDRLLVRGIPWRALPLSPAGEPAADDAQPAPGPDLRHAGPGAAVYDEARRRAAGAAALRHGARPLLWFDTTDGDRWGEAAGLLDLIRSWWPGAVRLPAAAGTGGGQAAGAAGRDPFAEVLVTAHRPLTMQQAHLLQAVLAAAGTGVAAGHPSLAGDLRRLLGPRWRIDALHDCSAPDLEALAPILAI